MLHGRVFVMKLRRLNEEEDKVILQRTCTTPAGRNEEHYSYNVHFIETD